MVFGEKVQKLRKSNNMSQEQLAEELNVSRQAISKWEMGSIPDVTNIMKISNYFDCSLDYLMNNDKTHPDDSNDVNKVNTLKESKKTIEQICISISFSTIMIILLLWIISKIIPSPIVRQDDISGNWYTGFLGFIDFYNLFWIVYFCIFIFITCLSGIVFTRAYKNRKYYANKTKRKSFIYGGISYLLIIIATLTWLYEFLRPEVFILDLTVFFLSVLYVFCIAICVFLSKYYWNVKDKT